MVAHRAALHLDELAQGARGPIRLDHSALIADHGLRLPAAPTRAILFVGQLRRGGLCARHRARLGTLMGRAVRPAGHDGPGAGALARRAIGLVAFVVVLALVVSVLPGLQDVRDRFSRADPVWLAATFACALASTLSYVTAVRGTLSRRFGWRASLTLGMAEQGSNVLVPTGGVGGPALGTLVMRRVGVPTAFAVPRSAALFLLTSATSFAAIAVAGIATGVGLLPGGISWVGTLLPAAVALAVLAAVAALGQLPVAERSEGERRSARWRRRIAGLLRDGVQESLALLRARDPLVIAAASAISPSTSRRWAPRSRPSAAEGRRWGRSSWPTRSGRWVRSSPRRAASAGPKAG